MPGNLNATGTNTFNTVNATTLRVGSSSNLQLQEMIVAADVALDFDVVIGNSNAAKDISIPGVKLGDPIAIGVTMDAGVSEQFIFTARVFAPNTVRVTLHNLGPTTNPDVIYFNFVIFGISHS